MTTLERLKKEYAAALVIKNITFAAGDTSESNKAIVIAEAAWRKYQVEL